MHGNQPSPKQSSIKLGISLLYFILSAFAYSSSTANFEYTMKSPENSLLIRFCELVEIDNPELGLKGEIDATILSRFEGYTVTELVSFLDLLSKEEPLGGIAHQDTHLVVYSMSSSSLKDDKKCILEISFIFKDCNLFSVDHGYLYEVRY